MNGAEPKPRLPALSEASRGTSSWRSYLLQSIDPVPLILLLLVALLLARGLAGGEPFFNVDETFHTMNGVFIRDALADRVVSHPMQYAKEYYAKYPAVKMPWWPPFFAFVEGLFFLVFGISVWVSRLAILFFALLSAYFWYRIAERFGPRSKAFSSALIFCLLPTIMVFESVVMLEVPQLATCLGAIYFWLRWLETERAQDLWIVAGFAAAAMLTSPASIFLALFLGVDFLLQGRFRLLRNWQVWCALSASLAIVLGWYLFAFRSLPETLGRGTGQAISPHARGLKLFYYPRALPSQLGWMLLILAGIGIGWCLWRELRKYRFLLLWIFSAYLSLTAIMEKQARHILIWIPPLIYFALIGVDVLLPKARWRWAGYAALGLYFFVQALMFSCPRLTGAEAAARFIFAQPESDIVYYRGNLDSDFIFWARQLDPQKSHMVAREKDLDLGYAEAQDQFLKLFQTWGVRYAVVDSMEFGPTSATGNYRQFTEPWLREALHSGQFDLVRTFPVKLNIGNSNAQPTNVYEYGGTKTIEVYRYRGEIHRSPQPVTVSVKSVGLNFSIDLNRLAGRPWPN